MLCSTNTTVRLLATSRASSTVRSTSSRPMPLVGSSSSSTRGSWVSEIPISRFRFWPWERSAARTCSLPFSRTCPAILRACRATTRFSRTVSVSNTLLIWKERDSPRSTILCGGSPAMVSPNSSTVPSLGCRNPDRQLNSVVFPAPLGPRMAWISPSSTERSTWSSARKPRNDRETARACNATGMGRTPYNPSHIPARYGASRQGGLDASFGEGGAGDRGGERYRPRHRAGLRARGRPGLRGGRERGGRRCGRAGAARSGHRDGRDARGPGRRRRPALRARAGRSRRDGLQRRRAAHRAADGVRLRRLAPRGGHPPRDRKSTRLNSSHVEISYAVFCLKKKKKSISIYYSKHKKHKSTE